MIYRSRISGPDGERTVEVEDTPDGHVTRITEDGEATERAATPEEVAAWEAHRKKVLRRSAVAARTEAMDRVVGTPLGDAILTLLVAEGVISVETAEAAGWSPPGSA